LARAAWAGGWYGICKQQPGMIFAVDGWFDCCRERKENVCGLGKSKAAHPDLFVI